MKKKEEKNLLSCPYTPICISCFLHCCLFNSQPSGTGHLYSLPPVAYVPFTSEHTAAWFLNPSLHWKWFWQGDQWLPPTGQWAVSSIPSGQFCSPNRLPKLSSLSFYGNSLFCCFSHLSSCCSFSFLHPFLQHWESLLSSRGSDGSATPRGKSVGTYFTVKALF